MGDGSRGRALLLPAGLAAGLLLSACGGDDVPGVGERNPGPGRPNLSFEEAAFIASGEPVRFYGEEADPVPVRVTGELDTVNGQRAWRIHMTVEFTRQGGRAREHWTFWVGFRNEEAGVLRSEGPRPADPAG